MLGILPLQQKVPLTKRAVFTMLASGILAMSEQYSRYHSISYI